MNAVVAGAEDTGLEVIDLASDPEFARRRIHVHNVVTQMTGMQRLAGAFVERPETILQELVRAAVELCGAESAGISIEKADGTDESFWHWVATAGEYSGFMDATLPRYPSACGICLERGKPQLFRVSRRFFELMGVEAPVVTDGLLLPWQVDETRGTIWIMAHGRGEAFDLDDVRMMEVLANFAAMGVRQQRLQRILMDQATVAAAAAMANDLAHQINNPLQSLTNVVYLAEQGGSGDGAKALAEDLSGDLQRLSGLVKRLLALPIG